MHEYQTFTGITSDEQSALLMTIIAISDSRQFIAAEFHWNFPLSPSQVMAVLAIYN